MERFVKRARALRSSQTNAEAKLWYRLRGKRLAQWKFRRQHQIDKYIVDFVTIPGKLVVEVDGATHSEPDEIQRDEERTRILEAFGFHVIRVSNTDVYENIDGVLELIATTLPSRDS
jgi:very-short-patch-repair endonuclease